MTVRIEVGKRRREPRKPTVRWQNWNAREGRYPVAYVFNPSQYPTYTVIFETETEYVRRTIQRDLVKALKQSGFDYQRHDLYFVVDTEGYYLEWQDGKGYEKTNYGLRRRTAERQEEELDIDF